MSRILILPMLFSEIQLVWDPLRASVRLSNPVVLIVMDCLFSSSSLITTTQGYSIFSYSCCHHPFSHLRAASKRCLEQIVVQYLMPNVLFAYEISTSINNLALNAVRKGISSEVIHYTIVLVGIFYCISLYHQTRFSQN